MSKTSDLRRLVNALVKPIIPCVYYRRASSSAQFPYAVFTFDRINIDDLHLDVFDLRFDLWDSAESITRLDDIADTIEKLLHMRNDPQPGILPTFFRSDRFYVEESDKKNQHLELHFDVRLYEREVST